MSLVQEYEFDALPYVDKEYDHPAVKDAVHALIIKEMRSFTPKDYLAHMPYPELKFSSSVLQNEYDRAEKCKLRGAPPAPADLSRYEVRAPEEALEKDLQAWKKSLSTAKSQFENQTNRLLNLELLESHGATVWLHHNRSLEGLENYVLKQTEKVRSRIESVNLQRKSSQEQIYPILLQLNHKRDQLISKCWQIERRCIELEAQCAGSTEAGLDESAATGKRLAENASSEGAEGKRIRTT